MKKIFVTTILLFLFNNSSIANEWKIQNKWKISCGLTDKEALVINGKPKKSYNKNSFKVDSAVFKLDKGEIGKCKPDKKVFFKCGTSASSIPFNPNLRASK